MKFLIPFLLLLLAACQTSPHIQERINVLERQAEEAQQRADQAETDEERLEFLEREHELRQEMARLKAEDHGQQSGMAFELILAALGLGGFGAVRTFGKSRASQEVAELRARLEAFERGFNQPAFPPMPPVPPDATDNKLT